MTLPELCRRCLYDKYSIRHPADAPAATVQQYRHELKRIIDAHDDVPSPQITEYINACRRELFGAIEDYTDIKHFFNQYMLQREGRMQAAVDAAADPLAMALRYALVGNLIDFGAFPQVNEDVLAAFLQAAENITLDAATLSMLRRELSAARTLCFMTDNCGEIVADKVLLRTLRRLYPSLHITVLVRGGPILNDATMEDAREVALLSVADRVLDNGCAVGGTLPSRLPQAASEAFLQADVRLAKGQGNYETLTDTPFSIYFAFLCKCQLFTERFHVPPCTALLIKEG